MGWLDALSVSTNMVYLWHQWERPVLYYVDQQDCVLLY